MNNSFREFTKKECIKIEVEYKYKEIKEIASDLKTCYSVIVNYLRQNNLQYPLPDLWDKKTEWVKSIGYDNCSDAIAEMGVNNFNQGYKNNK
tara:strand:+ start:2091 stop:2366 length:276 start_codon:yes stop_codon:yes gene_type:complete